jgi:acid stress-induced BolA-like protein IbaG/YrbA
MAKTAIAKSRLETSLTKRLKLQAPIFHLEALPDRKWSGSVVSDSFRGVANVDRQRRIWDALDAEFGPKSVAFVGTLLAYTQAEWNVDLTTPSKVTKSNRR